MRSVLVLAGMSTLVVVAAVMTNGHGDVFELMEEDALVNAPPGAMAGKKTPPKAPFTRPQTVEAMAKATPPTKNYKKGERKMKEGKAKAAAKKAKEKAEKKDIHMTKALKESREKADRSKESYVKTAKRNQKDCPDCGKVKDKKLVPKPRNPWMTKIQPTKLNPHPKLASEVTIMAFKAAKAQCNKVFTKARDSCNVFLGGKPAAVAAADAEMAAAQAALNNARLVQDVAPATNSAVKDETKSKDWPKKPKAELGESVNEKKEDIPKKCIALFTKANGECARLLKIAKGTVKLPDPAQVAAEQYQKYHEHLANKSARAKKKAKAKPSQPL